MDNAAFARLLDSVLPFATFSPRLSEVGNFRHNVYRSLYQDAIPNPYHSRYYLEIANTHFSLEEPKRALIDAVNDIMSENVRLGNPPKIGFGPRTFSEDSLISIEQLALCILRMAAATTSDAASAQLFSWRDGNPITITRYYMLRGVSIEEPFCLRDGVRFIRLPDDDGLLFDHVDQALVEQMFVERDRNEISYVKPNDEATSYFDFPNKTVLCVDTTFDPSFFHPNRIMSKETQKLDLVADAKQAMTEKEVDALLLAVSVYLDTNAYWDLSWWKEDNSKFFDFSGHGSARQHLHRIPDSPVQLLSPRYANDLNTAMQKFTNRRHRLTRAAVGWRNSRRNWAADGLPDLRMAMEALYVTEGRMEYRFRVSTNGAWHLGETFAERQKYRKLLQHIYDGASSVIHGRGEVPSEAEIHELHSKGRDICRDGISKMLREEGQDVNTLSLGRDLEEKYQRETDYLQEILLEFVNELSSETKGVRDPKDVLQRVLRRKGATGAAQQLLSALNQSDN